VSYFSEQYIRYCDDITNFGPDPDDIEIPRLLIDLTQKPNCPECNQPNGDHTGDCLAIN
jgi:hypothetical protein